MTNVDKLTEAVIRQACKDLYKLHHNHHKTKKQKQDEEEIIDFLNGLDLDILVDKIIIEGKRPIKDGFNPFSPYYNLELGENDTKVQTKIRNVHKTDLSQLKGTPLIERGYY